MNSTLSDKRKSHTQPFQKSNSNQVSETFFTSFVCDDDVPSNRQLMRWPLSNPDSHSSFPTSLTLPLFGSEIQGEEIENHLRIGMADYDKVCKETIPFPLNTDTIPSVTIRLSLSHAL